MPVTQQGPCRRSFVAAPAQAPPGKLVTARSSVVSKVSPEVLRWLYMTSEYEPTATDRNRLAVLGDDDEFPSQVDLTRFTKPLCQSRASRNLHRCTGE